MTGEQGTAMDMKAHEQTYNGFIRLLKVSTVLSAIVTLLIIFAISN